MEAALTIFYQIIKMFAMMAVGYVLYRKRIVSDDTTRVLSNILLMVTTPATIIASFNQTFSFEKLEGLMISFLLSFIIYTIQIICAELLFKKEKRVEKLAVSFSNAGFLGIPLVTGLLGIEAVFFLSAFIASSYVFTWTYAVIMMSGDKSNATIRKVLTNPCIIAMFIGLIIFFLPVKPFTPIMEAVSTLGSMTTPLAMLILGAYLAKTSFVEMFKNKTVYWVSFYRLIFVPLIIFIVLCFVPNEYEMIKKIMLISASAPVATLIPIFSQMFSRDVRLGAQIVSLSTILCLITMPCFIYLSEIIW